MMGMPINVPAYMFEDILSVVKCANIPECRISKNVLALFYHAVRASLVAVIWRVGFVKVKYNISEFLTKIMSDNAK